jgi:ribosomal protein S12 methylthiotransferase accessory factor
MDSTVQRAQSGPLRRVKPYKAAAPERTIDRIQDILAELCLQHREERVPSAGPGHAYVLRLLDTSRSSILFQTVGKGLTALYARASAYGEMMERLQNLAFYTMLKYPAEPEPSIPTGSPFKYYPDEKLLSSGELREGMGLLLRGDVSGQPHDTALTLGIPFWNVFPRRVQHLPLRAMLLVVGSNGMCSGNTQEEALIQGLSEVFERHVLKRFFLDPFCPPDVPLQLFAGHGIHDKLGALGQREGCRIRVKDCSLGRRLPVVGLLLQDGRGRYAFHLGADPSPVTALERCYTEMLQGGSLHFLDESALPDEPCDLRHSVFWRTQLHYNIRSYQGQWPRRLLDDRPDYAFEEFTNPVSLSDEEDLVYLLRIVRSERLQILIRDNSFLGFPSYYVYVPGFSEITNAVDNAFVRELLAFDLQLPVLSSPGHATQMQRLAAAEAIERYARVAPSRTFIAGEYMHFHPSHPLAVLQPAALLDRLRKGAPEELAALPPCFDCVLCAQREYCSYELLCQIWDRMKARMAASACEQWPLQASLRRLADRS